MNPRFYRRIQQARRRVARSRQRVERETTRISEGFRAAVNWRQQWGERPIMLLLGAAALGMAVSRVTSGKAKRAMIESCLCDIALGDAWARIWHGLTGDDQTSEQAQHSER